MSRPVGFFTPGNEIISSIVLPDIEYSFIKTFLFSDRQYEKSDGSNK